MKTMLSRLFSYSVPALGSAITGYATSALVARVVTARLADWYVAPVTFISVGFATLIFIAIGRAAEERTYPLGRGFLPTILVPLWLGVLLSLWHWSR